MSIKGTIPTGWIHKTIGDIYEVVGGGTPATARQEYWKGNIPWITSADIQGVRDIKISRYITKQAIENSTTNRVPSKTLLVVTRVGLGKIAIAQGNICFSQDLQGLIAPPELILPEFGLHYLSFALQALKHEGRGTTISGITKKQLKDTTFPLPPLNEQKRIVTKIEELFSELDKGIENLKTAREQLKIYRQAVLKHAFEGKLTAGWRDRNGIKGEWKRIPLKNVIEEPKYGTSKKCSYALNGTGVLRIPNIAAGAVDASDLKFAQFDEDEAKQYQLKEGDILTIRSNGSVAIVGQCALVSQKDEHFLYAGYLIRLRPKQDLISPRFLLNVLSSHELRILIENKAKSTSGVNNINSGEIKSLLIPICPIQEQKRIVEVLGEILSELDRAEKDITDNLQKSETLRQSILKQAFSGKLVAQDPKDEPAAVLLERIKAEKSGSKKGKSAA